MLRDFRRFCSVLLGHVELRGGTVLERWAGATDHAHQQWMTVANSSGCALVMGMGFGVGIGGYGKCCAGGATVVESARIVNMKHVR